ncbi:hypothetical protein EDB80DRAFT_755426 [Ilyonectria destructans]|nr:hypothetical protein EDB80DRAFT_755426 [Ilyonectria destructans]
MLVLIAGITGSLGQRLAREALSRGQSVRGLGRDPNKLQPQTLESLESFIKSSSYYDISALEKAVAGVDAVICAYAPQAELGMEGNLLLLRAAERANIKTFIAQSWNNDWTRIKFGDLEPYDSHIAFHRHVEMTSSIKPVYLFTGAFADLLYTALGPGGFDTSGPTPKLRYWADGNTKKYPWTTQDDAAAFTIEVLLNGAGVQEGRGGFFSFYSGQHTIEELATAYEKVSGTNVEVRSLESGGPTLAGSCSEANYVGGIPQGAYQRGIDGKPVVWLYVFSS